MNQYLSHKIEIFSFLILAFFTPLIANGGCKQGGNSISEINARRVVLDSQKSFASQIVSENTVYIIKNRFDLNNKTVVIPRGCKLEFEGGTIGNGTVDFTGCINHQIYYSWFSDFLTCNNSLLYLDNKELVIDKDLHITESFTFPRNKFKHQNITIRGAVSTRESRPRIISDNVPCFRVFGHFISFKDISFAVRGAAKDVACIEFECPMEGLNDVDCVISNCHFSHTGGGMAIKCKGRGITVENCIFQSPVSSVPNKDLNISAISLFPDDEPMYPVPEGTQWHDAESSGRSIIIRNNRLHLSNPGCLVGLYANPDCPEWAFHGVQIVNNLVDAEGSLCVITAKNYGTLISNNINYGRRASTSMYISNACEMIISNNIIGQLPIEQSLAEELYDIIFEPARQINQKLDAPLLSEISSVLIVDNVLGSYCGSVFFDSCNSIIDLTIAGNIYGRHSFAKNSDNLGAIVFNNVPKVSEISLRNNSLPYGKINTSIYCLMIFANNPYRYSNIQIFNNNFKHNILNKKVFIENLVIKKLLRESGSSNERPTSFLEPSDAGFMYFDTDLSIPIYWTGVKWVNSKGREK